MVTVTRYFTSLSNNLMKKRLNLDNLKEKFSESLAAVLPIVLIVLCLGFVLVRLETSTMLCFIFGTVLLIIGMMLFSLGAEMSMSQIGEKVGSAMTRTKKVWLIAIVCFILGTIVTVSEPDLSVLAGQLKDSIPQNLMIYSVAIGVGFYLVIAVLRMIFKISLNWLLIGSYAVIFALAIFVPKDFLSIAFDSGGVTTGPMTVPFIMALGVGISAIRSDKNASSDSFGLVSLCSAGPIIAVMVLGIVYRPSEANFAGVQPYNIPDSMELGRMFLHEFPSYMKEIALSLLPIAVFFAIFQIFIIKMSKENLKKILVGILYTYVGLVLFLTGAGVGFMPLGQDLGMKLASLNAKWILVPVAMLMGYFVVKAEPAVGVLNHQVEEMTDGAISANLMGTCLSFGVAASLGLAMVRVLTGISILWFLVPGYVIAIGATFFVPKIYTAIAFDSGGVASGPMTAAFLLPLAEGACMAVGGNIMSDAFGVVAMVAMTPLITVQVLGIVAKIKQSRAPKAVASYASELFADADDMSVINL